MSRRNTVRTGILGVLLLGFALGYARQPRTVFAEGIVLDVAQGYVITL